MVTCREGLLSVLDFVHDEGVVVGPALARLVSEAECPQGHELHVAAVEALVEPAPSVPGAYRLNPVGKDWLLDNGHPASSWAEHIGGCPELRDWQVEALDAWAAHGRQGVVEAVTGTGKSRVGIEAAREALRHGFSVIVVVPTIDLVDQWVKTLRKHMIPGVHIYAGHADGEWAAGGVVVGTVQSLYVAPPVRADGRVLLIADECHRYGAEQWRRALSPGYRRRLGLTATFERNDDGLPVLEDYFGGGPIYRIDFARAIDDGVVAEYDVKLLPVQLTRRERRDYDRAQEQLTDCRIRLLSAGFPEEPFGAFLHEVQQAAEQDDDPTVSDMARRYLKAFSERIDVLANAHAKIEAVGYLATLVKESKGALLFTRRIDSAEKIAERLAENDVSVATIHSDLGRSERRDRLSDLRSGRLRAIVAPTVLDEGIDVPDVDLGIVMSGSKSRRQMIQRMGRVLRKKSDGRSATFVVVYAENTVEDLSSHDGQEGCLDLIIDTARSVRQVKPDSEVKSDPDRGPSGSRPRAATSPGSNVLTKLDTATSLGTGLALPVPVVHAATPERTRTDGVSQEALPADEVSTRVRPTSGVDSVVDQLERLARLVEQGHLNEAEFAAAKSRILF